MTTVTRFRGHIRAIAWMVLIASLCAGVATAQQTIDGVTADGALYRFLVPSSWNGQLVVYAHGYVSAGDPIALPNTPIEQAAFQAITSQGFAVAMSSYAENGWAVKNGAQTTHQLRGLFAARVSEPARTYLVGTSEGGLVALDLTEGQPMGHSVRACIIGMRIAQHIGLPIQDQADLYYSLLLKDAGCSSNASRLFHILSADEIRAKGDVKTTDWTRVGWESLTMNLLCSPGGKEFWKERGYVFGNEYRDYVEKVIMTKKPHPEARPLGSFKLG